jgi:predicted secreted protein
MGPVTGIAIYITIWWTVLFAVLPWGVTSHAQAGIDKGDGGDPAAPVDPKLKQKFLTTTWISALLWMVVWAVLRFGLIDLPSLPSGY